MITAPRRATERLTLDPLTVADITAIFEIAREKESIEDYQYVARSLDDAKAWLEPGIEDKASVVWVIRQQGRSGSLR